MRELNKIEAPSPTISKDMASKQFTYNFQAKTNDFYTQNDDGTYDHSETPQSERKRREIRQMFYTQLGWFLLNAYKFMINCLYFVK